MKTRKKQPVVHCEISNRSGCGLITEVVGIDGLAPLRLIDMIGAGFHVGDRASIVMRRSGPKRAKRNGAK